MKRVFAGALLLLVGGLGVLYWRMPTADAASARVIAAEPAPGLLARMFVRGTAGTAPSFASGLENLPASLQGTEVDGALEADAAGHLRLDNGVRRTFDYFLSALGEESLDVIVARLHAWIRTQLPATAAAEAEKLLTAYLDYRRALAGIGAGAQPADGQLDVATMRAQQQQAKELRLQFFSPDAAAAFYADEDALNAYTLDRVAILQQRDTDAAQRARQLAVLEEKLPPALRESTHAVAQYQNLETLTDDWQTHRGTAAELRQIRENLLGAAAADRLEELDGQRAAWDRRMDAWLRERAVVLAAVGLGETDRHRQIDDLRTQRFTPDELLRVETLERIADQGATP